MVDAPVTGSIAGSPLYCRFMVDGDIMTSSSRFWIQTVVHPAINPPSCIFRVIAVSTPFAVLHAMLGPGRVAVSWDGLTCGRVYPPYARGYEENMLKEDSDSSPSDPPGGRRWWTWCMAHMRSRLLLLAEGGHAPPHRRCHLFQAKDRGQNEG
jgi:hypothetical protein